MNTASSFKVCSGCEKVWSTREDLLTDPEVTLNGYQPDFEDLEQGLFLFTHRRRNCGTTFALKVHLFSDLVKRPVLTPRQTGSDECRGYCLRQNSLEPCPVFCECAYVRDVIQIIRSKAANTA